MAACRAATEAKRVAPDRHTGAMTDLSPAPVPAVARLAGQVEWTDSEAAARARRHAPRGLGRLARHVEWLAETQGSWPPRAPVAARLVAFGTLPDRARTAARTAAITIVEPDLPPLDDATSETTSDAAVNAGADTADHELDAGADLLLVAVGATARVEAAAGMLVGLFSGAEPVALLPRGADAVDTAAWIVRAEQLRDSRRTALDLRDEPGALLAAAGSPELAAAVGLVLRAAARRVPVVLDGAGAAAAALLCQDVAPRATRWCRVADTSPDPALTRAAEDLGAPSLLDYGTRGGDGTAAVLAAAVLRTVAQLCTDPDAPAGNTTKDLP